ncbi:MAG: nitric oxide reductase transcription regulator [Bdellovibrionales bacterium GWB1_55_8]|nr:MAG: nitric oxide reductase transcription regulator [Bdellovibrionales bacterium GWB1_55_8]
MPQHLEAILAIATDLTSSINSQDRYDRLLKTVKSILRSDAAALLKKDGLSLRLIAADGMRPGALFSQYRLKEHPRFEMICKSTEPLQFPSDSPLPDPFDRCLEKNNGEEVHVHSCLGCPLIVKNELVGILAADSLSVGAFDHLDQRFLSTLGALAGATLLTGELINTLEKTVEKRGLVARDLVESANEMIGSFLIGTSPPIEKLRKEIEFGAKSDLTVLVSGETGTGKELVARSIQSQSHRKSDPMIYVNCAALPENLVESELFGHVRGAFTGANSHRAGKFEVADGGTLFLDEIGEVPLSVQAKLLRVLQEGEIQRVGSDQILKVNVRIIAATNRNLLEEVAKGQFRSDLYYRLNVYPIHVPALRDHPEDIAGLTRYFCDLNQRRLGVDSIHIHPETVRTLQKYSWPGNVRELKNVIDRTLLRIRLKDPAGKHLHMTASDLPADLKPNPGMDRQTATDLPSITPGSESHRSLRDATEDFQRQMILGALKHQKGNWAQTARNLGLHRSNLFSLAKRLGLK